MNTRDVPEIEIYQSAQTDFDVFEVKDKQGFSLRWFLEYRLRAALSKAWVCRAQSLTAPHAISQGPKRGH